MERWYLNDKCLQQDFFLTPAASFIKIANYSPERLHELTVKKKNLPSVNIMDDFSSKRLLSSLPISQRRPQSCLSSLPAAAAAAHPSLLPSLSGGQPQSNTTVSGSVGMQSADEPKVAHLCSVLASSQHAPAWLGKHTMNPCPLQSCGASPGEAHYMCFLLSNEINAWFNAVWRGEMGGLLRCYGLARQCSIHPNALKH